MNKQYMPKTQVPEIAKFSILDVFHGNFKLPVEMSVGTTTSRHMAQSDDIHALYDLVKCQRILSLLGVLHVICRQLLY